MVDELVHLISRPVTRANMAGLRCLGYQQLLPPDRSFLRSFTSLDTFVLGAEFISFRLTCNSKFVGGWGSLRECFATVETRLKRISRNAKSTRNRADVWLLFGLSSSYSLLEDFLGEFRHIEIAWWW